MARASDLRGWAGRWLPLWGVLAGLALFFLLVVATGVTGVGETAFYGIEGWPDAVYQLAHATVSFGVMIGIGALALVSSRRFPEAAPRVVPVGGVGWVLFALSKELLLDPRVEGDPFIWDGAQDLAFYLVGLSVALLVMRLLGWPARWSLRAPDPPGPGTVRPSEEGRKADIADPFLPADGGHEAPGKDP